MTSQNMNIPPIVRISFDFKIQKIRNRLRFESLKNKTNFR